jgi:hypothetical protein
MFAKPFLKTSLALAAVCTLWAGSAQATIHNLVFSGTVANGFFSSQDFGPTHFDQWMLSLEDPLQNLPITVELGDVINATVNLDGLFTVPGSVDVTVFGFTMGGAGFPLGDTETNGNFDFFDGMTLVKSGSGGTGTSGQIAAAAAFFPPNNGAFSFNSFTTSFTITILSGPATLDYAQIDYSLLSPAAVPEPATWAMMIIGFGGVGALMRRNRRDRGLVAFA